MNHPWVVVEQSEGLTVEYQNSPEVTVLFVDYDEASQNPDYVTEMIDTVESLMTSFKIPSEQGERILTILREYADEHITAAFSPFDEQLALLNERLNEAVNESDFHRRARHGVEIHSKLDRLDSGWGDLPECARKQQVRFKLDVLMSTLLRDVFAIDPAKVVK